MVFSIRADNNCIVKSLIMLTGHILSLPCNFFVDRFYIVLFSAFEQTHCTRMWFCMSEWLFIVFFLFSFLIHQNGVLTVLVWLVPHETAAVSALVLCTPYNHAPCHFMQSHIRKVHAYLAVTCHLHFWHHDQGLLRAAVITLGGTDTEIIWPIQYSKVTVITLSWSVFSFIWPVQYCRVTVVTLSWSLTVITVSWSLTVITVSWSLTVITVSWSEWRAMTLVGWEPGGWASSWRLQSTCWSPFPSSALGQSFQVSICVKWACLAWWQSAQLGSESWAVWPCGKVLV